MPASSASRGLARALLGAAAWAAVLLAAACGFDWTVRDAPGASADAADAGPSTDAPVGDAPSEGSALGDGAAAADAADAAACAALAGDLDAKKKAARTCKLSSGECQTTVKDQCGCDVFVAVPGSASVVEYQQGVTSFQGSGCPLGCGASCPPPPMFAPTCLAQGTGGNQCYP